jgi:hypothetical protein
MNFDPLAICRKLSEEGVEYVLLGGFGAVIHGSSLVTRDLDLIPASTEENLTRLSRALVKLNAKIRTESEPVGTKLDAQFLASMPKFLNLITDYGALDIAFRPEGMNSHFEEWLEDSLEYELAEGLVVRVASLEDIIESKKAANRPKDQMAMPYLLSLLQRRNEREG